MNGNQTLKEARADFFRFNDYGLDGGYKQRWIPLRSHGFTIYLFNSRSRKKAVPFHDLHHIITGYKTDAVGEMETAAWELGAGTHKMHFATVINLLALLMGTLRWPRRTFNAFQYGRQCESLYASNLHEVLNQTVEQVQSQLLPTKVRAAQLKDYLVFALLVVLAVVVHITPVAPVVYFC